jgi:hypothetical protein
VPSNNVVLGVPPGLAAVVAVPPKLAAVLGVPAIPILGVPRIGIGYLDGARTWLCIGAGPLLR